MVRQDLHTHTIFSDGADTPEDMVRAAIQKGMIRFGISDHSYTSFDESYCLKKDALPDYRRTLRDLKQAYASELDVLCGIEQDYYSEMPCEGFDYVIGSVHYLRVPSTSAGYDYIPVDESARILKDAADRYFGGDLIALAEAYFETVADVVRKTGADIIGHLDLISKFNEDSALFNKQDPRYIAAWKKAVDRLVPANVPFEINMGAISRGCRTSPYPAPDIISYIRKTGGRFILSSDAHSSETIGFMFREFESLLN